MSLNSSHILILMKYKRVYMCTGVMFKSVKENSKSIKIKKQASKKTKEWISVFSRVRHV